MPSDGPTLADLMSLLPDLQPRHLLLTKGISVKQLRLVSRELCIMACEAITSCEVDLGEGGSSPSPQQLVRLMAGAQLLKLKVTVNIMSGEIMYK